jgi:hypothetical protein
MSRLASVAYRLRQFRSSLAAQLSEEDRQWVDSLLSPGERELFYRMPGYDQTHSVRVAREAAAGGDGILLRAALLHDCGKALPPYGVPLLYRGLVVMLRAVSPRLLRAVARPWGPLWPVRLHLHHPELGAEALERAGSPRELVELVRRHQEPGSDPRLRTLQRADERN